MIAPGPTIHIAMSFNGLARRSNHASSFALNSRGFSVRVLSGRPASAGTSALIAQDWSPLNKAKRTRDRVVSAHDPRGTGARRARQFANQGGQGTPIETHFSTSAMNSSWRNGGGLRGTPPRSTPGDQAHSTRLVLRCGISVSSVIPPRAGSKRERQISPAVRPSHSIFRGARCQSSAPGNPAGEFLD